LAIIEKYLKLFQTFPGLKVKLKCLHTA